MSCAPWLSRGLRGGRHARTASLKHAAAEGNTGEAWETEEETRQRYQPLKSLPSAAGGGSQQAGSRLLQRQQRRAPRKLLRLRKAGRGESTAAAEGEGQSFRCACDSSATHEGRNGESASGAGGPSGSALWLDVPATFSDQAQQHATARNGSTNKSRSSGNSECSVSNRRRSSRLAASAGSPPSRPAGRGAASPGEERGGGEGGGEREHVSTPPAYCGTRAAEPSVRLSASPARAPARAAATSAGAAAAASSAESSRGSKAARGEGAAGRSRSRLKAAEQRDAAGRQREDAHGSLGASRGFVSERRKCEMEATNASSSRRTSLSRSSAARGCLASPPGEPSDETSEETAAHATAVGVRSAAEMAAAAGAAERMYRGAGEATRGLGPAAAAAAENEDCEEGREARFAAAGGSRYSRHSLLPGRRRTGRLTHRWSSAFLRSRRSTLPEDSVPAVLPMSETDWIIVERLSRKINSSNFATVLKAYLIIKTRVAAQRANKEYTQSQRKGRTGGALRLLLSRTNNRVALRMRSGETGRDATAAAARAVPAEAAGGAAAPREEEAAGSRREGDRSGKTESQLDRTSQRLNKGGGGWEGTTSRSRGDEDEAGGPDEGRQLRELAPAGSEAASVRGGFVVGSGELGETRKAALSSVSLAAETSSAADTSCAAPRRQEQNRLLGLKGVGEVGRMQAHQSLLEQRLAFLGLRSVCIKGDGNCLFRSCSYNLYGNEEYHRYVRLHATQHMRSATYQKEYSIFFECETEFDTYLKNMQRLGTWGDELCVRAIADSFECTIHIITSTDSNWYLRYDPQTARPTAEEEGNNDEEVARAGRYAAVALMQPVKAVRHIFLTYISPIHYNAFTIAEEDLSESQTK